MTSPHRLSALRDAREAVHVDGDRGAALAILLALLLLPAIFGGERLAELLRYDRSALAAGQWWRMASGQFVHLDHGHAFANAAGAVLVWALVAGQYRAWNWALIAMLCVLATAAGLWWGSPEVTWYVGASGWLHGMLAAGTARMSMRPGDRLGRFTLLLLGGKLLWEQQVGPIGGHAPVIVDAHLYGCLGGLLCALMPNRRCPGSAAAARGATRL